MSKTYGLIDGILDMLYIPAHISEIANRIYNAKTGEIDTDWLRRNAESYQILAKATELKKKNKITAQDIVGLAEEVYDIIEREKEVKKLEEEKQKIIEQNEKAKSARKKSKTKKRHHIPDKVKMFVWRRDQGRCVRCGSRENLEYDHIIPVSKGGSNTARNIELLCQQCNRKKSNKIAIED